MQRSTIEWTDYTSNPLRARRIATGKTGHHCVKVSAECACCYAESWNKRFGTHQPFEKDAQSQVEMFVDEREFQQLRKLNARSHALGQRPYVFICDMTDLFQQAVSDDLLDAVFAVMEECTHLRFQVLTKRAVRMHSYLSKRWKQSVPGQLSLGVSVGLANTTWRLAYLLKTPAALRFVSAEPLLEELNLRPFLKHRYLPSANGAGCGLCRSGDGTENFQHSPEAHGPFLDHVIVGGMSGTRAAPTNLNHIDALVAQCGDTDTPVFVKQLGSKPFYVDQSGTRTPYPISDGKGGAITDFPCHFVRQMPDGTER